MGNLIPGQALIYERVGDDIFARYRDPPHNQIPRWHIGGANAPTQADWNEIVKLAEEYPTLKKQLDKTLNLYYILKEKAGV